MLKFERRVYACLRIAWQSVQHRPPLHQGAVRCRAGGRGHRSAQRHISGNFISSKYFAPVVPALRHEFRVSSPLSRQTKQYESAMQNKNSICIHIRRGDYAANEHTKRFHGLIGLEHFTRAMAFIEERVAEPVYYVFSDDPLPVGSARANPKPPSVPRK